MHSASVCRYSAMPCAVSPPGTSTKRTLAATTFLDLSSSDNTVSLGSGTSTTAWFERPPDEPCWVSAVKRVDLPAYGVPTIPTSFIRSTLAG